MLRDAERHDAHAARLVAGLLHLGAYIVHERLRLHLVHARARTNLLEAPVRHEHELHAETRRVRRRREREETVLVVVLVAEGDQRLVPAAVVPVEVRGRNTGDQTLVEDALLVGDQLLVRLVVLVLHVPFLEEARWRHLLRVSHHHELLAARDHANGVPHRNLRRLVEHHEVERWRVHRQVLRNRERAHQEARLQDRQQRSRLGEHRAHSLLARLLLALALDDA